MLKKVILPHPRRYFINYFLYLLESRYFIRMLLHLQFQIINDLKCLKFTDTGLVLDIKYIYHSTVVVTADLFYWSYICKSNYFREPQITP